MEGVGAAFTTPVTDNAGALHYIVEIPADLDGTPEKEGGVAGDAITFTLVGRVLAVSAWQGGANTWLDLHPPAPTLVALSPLVAGSPITLDAATSADAGDDIVTFAFDCGADGVYEIGPQVSPIATCAFATTGLHPVGVRATDAQGGSGVAVVTLTVAPASHALTLMPGWNLVSFAVIPPNPLITHVLASIAGHYDLVYAWHAASQSWLKFDANAPAYANSLSTLDRNMGFWIHITTAGQTLVVSGDAPVLTTIPVYAGWNLTGYPAGVSRALPGALAGANFSLVYAYHAADTGDPWKLFDATSPFGNDLTSLSPGWGYWVRSDGASNWAVPYSAP